MIIETYNLNGWLLGQPLQKLFWFLGEGVMWNTPTEEQLAAVPRLYETEHVDLKDKLIHLHFFIGGCDWYAVEFDGRDLFWGFTILNDDFVNAEWDYFSFNELKSIKAYGVEIECDLYWKISPACEVEKIAACHF